MEVLNFNMLHVVAALLSLVTSTLAAGYFELQILEISNNNNHLLNGYCCGLSLERRLTETTNCPPCQTSFRLCLKEYQSAQQQSDISGMVGCAFGNASTTVLGGSSFVMSEPGVGALILPFSFRWTKSFTLILQALDMYNTSYAVAEQLIEETSYSDVILPSPEWRTLDHIGKNARITYRIRVQCSDNYYNSTCTIFCRPRNDQFGHHECDEQGNKVCLPGWQGTNCERAICKAGCDPVHGSCAHPGGCECRIGWRGPLCNECMVYPGCAHGYCNGVAWQCICDTNWGGILCDQDLNYCGTHEPCMHGGTCENTAPDQYRCTCPDGLSGNRCEVIEHPCATRPCKNGGTCQLLNSSMYSTGNDMRWDAAKVKAKNDTEFTCTCAVGWTGPACEINIDECAGDPCEHDGECIDLVGGFKCRCPATWTGDYCQLDVDECETNKPCSNAKSCTNTAGGFQCDCLDGWGGATCTENLNDCVGQCKNGATCIDKVNDFHCVCVSGYSGRDCSTEIDECAHSPCQNGGECVDLVGSFKCICPVGYSGTLCEAARDHCTPSPCVDGKCMNTAKGYYCHCPIGRTGKHCELLRTACPNPPCIDKCSPATNGTESTVTCSGRGKCEMGASGTYCVCQQGFSGTYCQENINECISNPCKNGGICNDGDGSFVCKCQSGWNGATCTEKASNCLQGQCLNGGSCIPSTVGQGMAQCQCPIGWGGPFCNEPVDQCLGQPCHNGGTCETGAGWFRCVCANGFSGPDCRINVNECWPQPCLGGGTCKDGIGSFTCICPPGRRGQRCEILLSDPSSVCASAETGVSFEDPSRAGDNSSCNSCICLNGKPHCSNLWCGLPNCLSKKRINSDCQQYEVCVPTSQETCLRPPCQPKGDCRMYESSRRVAPPSYPAPVDCWPNQAVLDDQCSRVSVLLELSQLPKGASVDSLCHSLRVLIGEKLLQSSKAVANTLLVLLCDMKNGTNDTLEMTISSPPRGKAGAEAIKTAVRHLEELFSRSIKSLENSFFLEHPEAKPLSAILEIKVETESVRNAPNRFFLAILLGIGVVALLCGGCVLILWRKRKASLSTSGVNLAPSLDSSRFEEEKHNNLQNEENIRRYANPLKSSITSIHGAMELNFSPTPDVAQLSHTAGHSSAQHRSQILYPSDNDTFDTDHHLKSQHHRQSQHLLYKTQNTDMSKNTENWVEIKNKIPKNIVL